MSFSYDDYIRLFCNDGFLVPQLKLEIPLFRYRGNLDNIINEIENDHIYMAPLEILNDPFDSSCSMSFDETCQMTNPAMYFYNGSYFLHNYTWSSKLKSYIEALPEESISLVDFSKIVSDFAKGMGEIISSDLICEMYYQHSFHKPTKKRVCGKVACFSETWESIPMWSYYADSHKGVCMKYNFELLDVSDSRFEKIIPSLHKVWYSEQRFADAKDTFAPFVKSLQWAHEQEWRLFREHEDNYLYIPCISEIYLGINFDFDNFQRISEAIKKNGRDIKVFWTHPKPNTYGFNRIRIYLSE